MSPATLTAWVLVAGIVFYLGWETYTLSTKAPDDHITAVVRKAVKKHPFIAFAFGVLCGHLFWA